MLISILNKPNNNCNLNKRDSKKGNSTQSLKFLFQFSQFLFRQNFGFGFSRLFFNVFAFFLFMIVQANY